MILGQDKQYQSLLSTFPFTPQSIPETPGFIFQARWFPQFVFYIRPDRYDLPIRMCSMSTKQDVLVLHFADAVDNIFQAHLVRDQHKYRTAPIMDRYNVICGLITYDTSIVLYMLPILNIIHLGSWTTPANSFMLDPAVLTPMANIGVQRITDSQDNVVQQIKLQTNICYIPAYQQIDMLCDISPIQGNSIQYVVIESPENVVQLNVANKHITLTHSIKSDVRVITDSNYITISGAADI